MPHEPIQEHEKTKPNLERPVNPIILDLLEGERGARNEIAKTIDLLIEPGVVPELFHEASLELLRGMKEYLSEIEMLLELLQSE